MKSIKKIIINYGVNDMVLTIIVPLISLIIGVLFSNFLNSTTQETVIISLLLMIFLSLIENTLKTQSNSKKNYKSSSQLETKIDELKIFAEIKDLVFKQKHQYFKEWGLIKLEKFIDENRDFFKGTNYTTPHSEDTFGIPGLKLTKRFGTIRALSSVKDYWEDDFIDDYLETQRILIAEKDVKIQRIFVINKNQLNNVKAIMEYQKKIGIDVFFIFIGNDYINSEWLEEDYLIQDDKLLVQIVIKSHKFNRDASNSELITLKESIVNNRIKRFKRISERAQKYTNENWSKAIAKIDGSLPQKVILDDQVFSHPL